MSNACFGQGVVYAGSPMVPRFKTPDGSDRKQCCHSISPIPPIATTPIQDLPGLPRAFFYRPAEEVAPELIGCLLVKREAGGKLLWGVIVETEAYSQEEPVCDGYRHRSAELIACLQVKS